MASSQGSYLSCHNSNGKTALKDMGEDLRSKLTTQINGASSAELELWAQAMMPLPAKDNCLIYPSVQDFQPIDFKSNDTFLQGGDGDPASTQEPFEPFGLCIDGPMANTVVAEKKTTEFPEPSVKQFKAKKLPIGDAAAVAAFLEDRIRRLQQIPVKRLVKAWIKGICPKKQTMFPYNRKQEDNKPPIETKVPPWWPSQQVCKFKEPDHIMRRERISLCLHILRLRPSPEVWTEWNDGRIPASDVHRLEGWTEFLRKLAPTSIVEEFHDVPKDKISRRRHLLEQIYDVSRLEEDLQVGALDDDFVYLYSEPEEPGPKKAKRSRRLSTEGRVGERSRSTSSCRSAGPAKKLKRSDKRRQSGTSSVIPKLELDDWNETEVDSDGEADADVDFISDAHTSFSTVASSSSSAAAPSRRIAAPTPRGAVSTVTRNTGSQQINPLIPQLTQGGRSRIRVQDRDTKSSKQHIDQSQLSTQHRFGGGYHHGYSQGPIHQHERNLGAMSRSDPPNMPVMMGHPEAAVYHSGHMPPPAFYPSGPMSHWPPHGMPPFHSTDDYFAPSLGPDPSMAAMDYPLMPGDMAFRPDGYMCDPQATMLQPGSAHFHPSIPWQIQSGQERVETTNLNHSFGNEHRM